MQRDQFSSKERSYSFKVVNPDEFEYDESVPVENAREIPSPILSSSSQRKKCGNEYVHNSFSTDLLGSDSEDEIIIREPSTNPSRFNAKSPSAKLSQKNVSSSRNVPQHQTMERSESSLHEEKPSMQQSQFSDSGSEDENLGNLERKPIPGQYDPDQFENLDVSPEIKELFQYIPKYSPQHLNLDYKLKPFVSDLIPAVGDIDAFLKVIPPDRTINGDLFDSNEQQLGLTILDEPSMKQSDPALLHLQLRANSFNVGQADETVVVKKVENAEQSFKTIDKWVKDVTDLHKSKSPPIVRYSNPMPDLDDLMQEWPEEVENLLKIHGFPNSKCSCSLSDYIDIVCSVFDIPIHKNKIESLYMLFCLYAAIKNSQLYKSTNDVGNGENVTVSTENKADQLVLD